ncbi:hypothetical protein BBO_04499 [Beauveria brongniartii RCEF 3172]|uniref:Dynein light chain-related protein n=1 Tax=Beauveria brongniartii RCEF 3172 TaxID=1081107 RepID=A0A167E5S6_9HYPO|nr:hypothetical protein BBO_04499 [Beauveria brongniartii RCEF 3172]
MMADVTNGNSAILDEKLSRLSKKPGVKASIVIDRASGSILKTSGDVSVLGTTQSRTASTAASFSNEPAAAEESTSKGIDDFAAMIWKFVNNSGAMVEEMDKDVCCCRVPSAKKKPGEGMLTSDQDDLRLLRLRTKKHEIVIVLDPRYLLTVIHDSPSS